MKTLKLMIVALMIAAGTQAQIPKQFAKVDLKDIKTKVMEAPAHVRDLVNRLYEGDDKLTDEEMIQAFYGQSYITNDGEEYFVFQMREALRKNDKKSALQAANDVMAVNKLNLDAINTKTEIMEQMMDDTTDSTATPPSQADIDDAKKLAQRICKVIASTGDGTANNPYVLTKAHDEYNFLSQYLKITKVNGASQQMGNLDILRLGEKSDRFDKDVIYFDISRVQELEKFLESQEKEQAMF
jgi:hypothetical protein